MAVRVPIVSEFNPRGLAEAERELNKLGKRAEDFGRKMTQRVTLPLVGIAAGAVKLASDFESSMSKIQALVGLTGDEVDAMRGSVLELSGRTARAPQELADALFVLTSAGLRGGDALEALEYSAKASAAGLGETSDIARSVAGVMNAYGPGVMSAARATDVLTATARAGNFETSQLAGALGRVLPFAQQAQASFEDVGGAVALLTRTNGDAAQSVTQVQALMRAFVVPTAEATKALESMGLTAGDVRDSIGTDGLVATLQMLDDRLGGNREQLGRLLGSSEAASAAFQILNADTQTIQDTFGTTAKAAGMTDEAFGIMADTAQFKMKQAWSEMQTALINLGAVLLPIVSTITGGLADVAGAFANLPAPVMMVVAAFGGLAAAAGPAVWILGRTAESLTRLGVSATTTSRVTRTMGTAMGVAGVAMLAYSLNAAQAAREQDRLNGHLADLDRTAGTADSLNVLSAALAQSVLKTNDLSKSIAEVVEANYAGSLAAVEYAEANGVAELSIGGKKVAVEQLRAAVDAEAEALERARRTQEDANQTTADATTEAMELELALAAQEQQLADVRREQEEATRALERNIDVVRQSRDATYALHQANVTAKEELGRYLSTMMDANATEDERVTALHRAEKAYLDLAWQAAESASIQQEQLTGTAMTAEEKAAIVIAELGKVAQTLDPNDPLRKNLDGYSSELRNIPEVVSSQLLLDAAPAWQALSDLERRMSRGFVTNMHVVGAAGTPIRFASGTPSAPGGPAIVGEQGIELVDLPAGSRVHDTRSSRNMLAAAARSSERAGPLVNIERAEFHDGTDVDGFAAALSMRVAVLS